MFVATYFKKGQEIILSGSMQCSKYQDDDGTSRNYWEVNVNEVEFCGSRKENENQSYSQSPAPSVTPTDFDEVIDDDDLPF